jgi:ABC-type multidrug transport system permease subunit
LADIDITVGDQSLNLGEQLQQNPNLNLEAGDLASSNFSLNFGNQLAGILLSQPVSGSGLLSGTDGGFDLSEVTCPLIPEDEQGENAFEGSLDDLFDAEAVSDAGVAQEGVMNGEYAAAVIIPPGFSNYLAPDFGLNASATSTGTITGTVPGTVEVIANNATPISASIVRAVVEGIVGQFERVNVALSAFFLTTIDTVQSIEPSQVDASNVDPTLISLSLITNTIQNVDSSALEPLGCLLLPGANNIQIEQQPLNETQSRSPFSFIMVLIGGAQAVFFALFTGVFGINSIYEDRRQGTLQRVLVAPVSSSDVLFGRLLGNLVIVTCQLLILLSAFTTIASLVEGELTFIWGTNLPALLLVVLGLSLFTTGMGVLIVGLASSSEQVQLIGPVITLMLGALGGTFGPIIPPGLAQFSPTWWGLDAMQKLAANEGDIGINLLVLFSVGLLFALVGTFFFRRRMGL